MRASLTKAERAALEELERGGAVPLSPVDGSLEHRHGMALVAALRRRALIHVRSVSAGGARTLCDTLTVKGLSELSKARKAGA